MTRNEYWEIDEAYLGHLFGGLIEIDAVDCWNLLDLSIHVECRVVRLISRQTQFP